VLANCLTRFGYSVIAVPGGPEALDELEKRPFDLVISDLSMPVMDGIALLEEMRRRNVLIPFIVVTACSSIESVVTAMRMGASDYIEKPFSFDSLHLIVQRALQHHQVVTENRAVREYLHERYTFKNILTDCPAMMETLQIATAAEEHTATTSEITTNISQITDVVHSTVRGATETAAASSQLSREAEHLQQLVGQFKL
jgi:two-component system NtrC family response regulator